MFELEQEEDKDLGLSVNNETLNEIDEEIDKLEMEGKVLEELEEAGDALAAESRRARDEKVIQELVIAAQGVAAKLNNRLDAYQRAYSDLESRFRMAQWTKSALASYDKAARASKAGVFDMIPAGTTSASANVGSYSFVAEITAGGISLDTAKFKANDPIVYEKIMKIYPRKKAPTKKLTIKNVGLTGE